MPKRILTPKQSLLKGYMTLLISKEAVSVFKEEMRTLADRIKTEESEEYNKNLIMQSSRKSMVTRTGLSSHRATSLSTSVTRSFGRRGWISSTGRKSVTVVMWKKVHTCWDRSTGRRSRKPTILSTLSASATRPWVVGTLSSQPSNGK